MMREVLYFLMLAAEALTGLLMLGLLYSNVGWLACVAVLVIWVALLIPQVRKLSGAAGVPERKRARRNIALVMLIPVGTGLILAAYTVISLLLYFG